MEIKEIIIGYIIWFVVILVLGLIRRKAKKEKIKKLTSILGLTIFYIGLFFLFALILASV